VKPVRVTVVLTHPIQYFSPWFKNIAARAGSAIALTVVYVTAPSAEQRGAGFGCAVEWGTPLLEGYDWRVVRDGRDDDSVAAESFWGLGVAGVAKAVLDSRPEVVVVPGWHAAAYLQVLISCRLHRIPVLYRGDTHLGSAPGGWRWPLWRVKSWLMLRLFDGYLAVGTRSREYLLAHGIARSRIFDSPHAADSPFFVRHAEPYRTDAARRAIRKSLGLPPDAFVVLFIGKLSPIKRPRDVVRAAAAAGDVAVLIAGAGELDAEVRDEARRAGVPFACTGFVDQVAIGRAYAAADCLVMPSESETWGFAVCEALATGLPCIVSDRVGCAPDLITTPLAGAVVPVGDVAALAGALAALRARVRHDRSAVAAACREAVSARDFGAATAGLVAAARAVTRAPAADVSASSPPHPAARLLVCGGGLVTLGGAERMTFEIIRVCREHAGSVHVLVNDWGSETIVKAVESMGATWSYTWLRAPLRRSNLTLVGVLRYAWEFLRSSASVMHAAWRTRPTRVLVIDYTSALRNCFALLALRLWGIPVLMKLQNAPETGAFYRRLMRWLVNPLISTFVSNSHFTERALLDCGIPRRKSVVIYNTLPVRTSPSLRVQRQPGRIVYVGQIIPEKGVDALLDAVAILVRRGLNVSLDVVGAVDGWGTPDVIEFRSRIRAKAGAAPLHGVVRLLGVQELVAPYLDAAEVHCCPSLPSIREAFGLVVLEAKHAGIPSVVFPSGALTELVTHRVDGWVCAESTAQALADGLEFFLADRDVRTAAGQRALESAARFDRRSFSDKWWSLMADGEASVTAPASHAEVA
jgi:glycosyltransferase involved in cell wall biosynthesis